MPCTLKETIIKDTIAFHGHNCPGLTIGIRVAELARKRLNIHHSKSPVCVTETDMCGVDAIQFLTGCSYGKGNLIHKDYGKSAFTFYDRDTQNGFRALFNDNTTGAKDEALSLEEQKQQRITQLLAADLNDLFQIQEINKPPVRPARIMKSMACSSCGEMTMESRIRLFDGKTLCMPCFKGVEQKI